MRKFTAYWKMTCQRKFEKFESSKKKNERKEERKKGGRKMKRIETINE